MQTLKFIPLTVVSLGLGFVVGCAGTTEDATEGIGSLSQQQQGEEQVPQDQEQVPQGQEQGQEGQIPGQEQQSPFGQLPDMQQPQFPQLPQLPQLGGMQQPGEEQAIPPQGEEQQAPDATVADDDIQWGFRGGAVRGGWGGYRGGWGGGWGGGWRGGWGGAGWGWGRPGWGGGWGWGRPGWGAGWGWGRPGGFGFGPGNINGGWNRVGRF